MEKTQYEKTAMTVSVVTMAGNVLLALFKFLAGFLAHSGAMVSDAVHSSSDVFSTLIVMAGVRLAGKPADEGHPYGHDRFECIAAIILAGVLCVTGLGIGYTGITKALSGQALAAPGALALMAAVTSIVVKEAMYWYTILAARKLDSPGLRASAWHHRSDALSSVGSFAGILGARMGLPVLDPVASVAISLFIVKTAWDIFMDGARRMTDTSCGPEMEKGLRDAVAATEGVVAVDRVSTRVFGSGAYVEVEIQVDKNRPLEEAHAISQQCHDKVEKGFPTVKHCMVHVNPTA